MNDIIMSDDKLITLKLSKLKLVFKLLLFAVCYLFQFLYSLCDAHIMITNSMKCWINGILESKSIDFYIILKIHSFNIYFDTIDSICNQNLFIQLKRGIFVIRVAIFLSVDTNIDWKSTEWGNTQNKCKSYLSSWYCRQQNKC